MKKHCILLLVSFLNITFLFGQISHTVNFRVSDVEVRLDADGYTHLYMQDTYSIDEAGKPDLPVCYRTFVLPADAEVTDIELGSVARERIAGSPLVFPVQPPVPTHIQQVEIDFTPPDPDVYNFNHPFPEKPVEVLSDRTEMGYHLVTVKISPLEYLPQSRELFLCNFDFIIRYRTKATLQSVQPEPLTSPLRQEKVNRSIYQRVENKADVERFQRVSQRTSGIQRSLYGRDVEKLKIPDYIIITNQELYSSFYPLAEWKTKKGVNTIIKTVEEIGREFPGCDLQEKIRNYLKQAHALWGDGMFVLLGGHSNIIPA